jgi:gluconolactonase
MTSYKIETIIRGTALGEGPHWVPETQDLYYVDIFDPAAFRYVPATGKVYKLPLGDTKPSFIIPLEGQKNKFVIGYHRDLVLLEWDGESSKPTSFKTILSIPESSVSTRFNDAKCDPQGRIWVGTYGETEDGFLQERGILYSLDLNGKLTQHVDKINLSNGLAWSKDSTKFYFADSNSYVVYVFDFNAVNGKLSNKKVFFDVKKNGFAGIPDGLTIDAEDNVYVALFGGAKVLRLDGRTGALISTIDFQGKASNITSLGFGGPNLDELYVTSASVLTTPEQIASGSEAEAGAVFRVTNLGAKAPSAPVNYKGKLNL